MIGTAVAAMFQLGLVGAVRVDFARPVSLSLASRPVTYNGTDLSILTAGKCRFELVNRVSVVEAPEPEPGLYGVTWGRLPEVAASTVLFDISLKVTLHAAVAQYNKVDYRVSGAIFDAKGRLLGTASVVEHVDYVRLGRMPTLFKDLTFDFGSSRDFKDAAFAVFSVSNPSVPKPPDG